MPLNRPVGVNVSPPGSVPAVTAKLYAPVPPEAVIFWEKFVPVVAFESVGGSTLIDGQGGVRQAENSEVSLVSAFMTTAVMTGFPATGVYGNINVAKPELLVVINCDPRNTSPSPLPDASQVALAKNSTFVLALTPTCSSPEIVLPASDRRIGKFNNPFGPVSVSPLSLGVTPAVPRSIPSPALAKIEFPEILLLFPPAKSDMPAPPLKAIVLLDAPKPSMRLLALVPLGKEMPCDPLPSADVPSSFVPIRFPSMLLKFEAAITRMPAPVLPEIRLPSLTVPPPMFEDVAESRLMPDPLGTALVPVEFAPMMLLRMVVPSAASTAIPANVLPEIMLRSASDPPMVVP